ncbi:MAG: hypothetical protein EA381_07310 [Planctomycetaceae bacterium]|nr:MAG: hypothetical protein EA381_07310 [Planctomycetaceae bacterium]
MSKTVVAIVTFVAGLMFGVLGLIAVVANIGAFIGKPLASLSQPELPESEAESLQRAAVVRELMFVSHLQKQAGILDGAGFMGIRFESPDATSQKFWQNLLGYGDSDAQVTILSKVYRTHDYFAETFRTEASPDEAGQDVDENRTYKNSRRTIVEPAYGAPPLRSFSGLARISPQNDDELFIHFDLTYVWVDNRWTELVRSVTELPPQARDPASNDDHNRDASP